jgi:hypothetical protein
MLDFRSLKRRAWRQTLSKALRYGVVTMFNIFVNKCADNEHMISSPGMLSETDLIRAHGVIFGHVFV